MTYLLDTNTCIVHLNNRSSAVSTRFHATPLDQMMVCSVVKAELFYGAMKSNNPIKTLKGLGAYALILDQPAPRLDYL